MIQLISFLYAFLVVGYNAALKADFVEMTVPKVPYKSLEALADGLNAKKLRLIVGNSLKYVRNEMENSERSDWQMLRDAVWKRPIVLGGSTTENRCEKLQYSFE